MNILIEVAAADCAVGDNLIEGHQQERVAYGRLISAYGLTGSTAIGDTELEIRVDGKRRITLINTELTLALVPAQKLGCREFVPPNALVEVVCTDAANTNPVKLAIDFLP